MSRVNEEFGNEEFDFAEPGLYDGLYDDHDDDSAEVRMSARAPVARTDRLRFAANDVLACVECGNTYRFEEAQRCVRPAQACGPCWSGALSVGCVMWPFNVPMSFDAEWQRSKRERMARRRGWRPSGRHSEPEMAHETYHARSDWRQDGYLCVSGQ